MDILVGVCGRNTSFEALERAIERAEAADDEVTVAVLDDPSVELPVSDVCERVRSIVTESEVAHEIREVDGQPGARIVEIAEADGFDQLVIGDCGRTPMGKIRLDHIAQFILLNAEVTVTLVR